jgi:hypothetical protein
LTFCIDFQYWSIILVISVGPPLEDILLTADAARVPSETRRRVLVQTEVCASLEEGIVNVKAIDPADGAGPHTVTRAAAVAIANGDRNHPMLGV